MKDYSVDSRGDVGSWVRDASAHGLELCFQIGKRSEIHLDKSTRFEMIECILLSCLEKIDRIRESAGAILNRLLQDRAIEISHRNELEGILVGGESLNWLNPAEVIPFMTNLLHIAVFRKAIMTGLVLNIGGLTESLVRHSTESLSSFINSLPNAFNDSSTLTHPRDILETLRDVFQDYAGVDRVSVPLLETLDIYLSLGYLSQVIKDLEILEIVNQIFNLTKKEVFKSKNTKKLHVGIKVFTGFASLVDDIEFAAVQKLATEKLILYLVHPYPIVSDLYLLITS